MHLCTVSWVQLTLLRVIQKDLRAQHNLFNINNNTAFLRLNKSHTCPLLCLFNNPLTFDMKETNLRVIIIVIHFCLYSNKSQVFFSSHEHILIIFMHHIFYHIFPCIRSGTIFLLKTIFIIMYIYVYIFSSLQIFIFFSSENCPIQGKISLWLILAPNISRRKVEFSHDF